MRSLSIFSVLLVTVFAFQITLAEQPKTPNNFAAELKKLYAEDQADRDFNRPNINWEEVSIRDEQRERRVKEMLTLGSLGSGLEYYRAAMILQHASTPDDYLLAHDLSVIALSKGEEKAKWLAAATMDRFLISVGRQQRFGTQFQSNKSHLPPRLVPTNPDVTDTLRKELNVPVLADAKKREKEMEKLFIQNRKNLQKSTAP